MNDISIRTVLTSGLALILSLFVFYTSFFGSFETLIQRSLFVMAIVALGLLMYPTKHKGHIFSVIDGAMLTIVVVSGVYILFNFTNIMTNLPMAENYDIAMAFGTLTVILILAHRVSSIVFPIIVSTAVIYTLFGDLIPGRMGHRGFDIYYVTEVIFLGDKGLWGMLVNVASTTLAAFVLFGALLLHTGAGEVFFKLARSLAGRSVGGAAKIATVASAFFATISGSTVANVATTGNFTIPLMKRLNYPAPMAGGIEAIASTGGQLMPPIMGTAAFVMAELVGVNYWLVVGAAFLPAIFFYSGILFSIHLAAEKSDIQEISADDEVFDNQPLTLLEISPILAGFGGILFGVLNGNSIGLTACFGMIGIIAAFCVKELLGKSAIKQIASTLVEAFIAGGRGVVIVGILLVAAQVFVSMVNLTGMGVAISSGILDLAEGDLVIITGVMAAVCLIAGMGLPTSAAYVLVAAVFAPALINQGLDPLAVHLFVLYFACLSVITPPVCVGAFVASTIAETEWLGVAKYSMAIGAGCYCIPFLFFAYPGLLLQGGWQDILMAIFAGSVVSIAIPMVIFRFPRHLKLAAIGSWLLAFVGLGTLLLPSLAWSATGAVVVIGAWWIGRKLSLPQSQKEIDHAANS